MNTAQTAKVFAALGHEGRLSMFRMLTTVGPAGLPAGEIARRTGQLQNTTSSSLAVLTHAGLVSPRREGRSIFYAVVPSTTREALEVLMETLAVERDHDAA